MNQEVKEPEKISAFQEHFLDCLLHVLARNRGKDNATKTFTKLIDFITYTREMLHTKMNKLPEIMASAISKAITQDVKYSRIFGEVYSFPENYLEDLDKDFTALSMD